MASNTDLPKTITVAIVQMKPKPLFPTENLSYATSQIRAASTQHPSTSPTPLLAILPEYHLTGWEPAHPEFLSIAKDSAKYIRAYQDLAWELGICICAGTIVMTVDQVHSLPSGKDETGAMVGDERDDDESTGKGEQGGHDGEQRLLNVSYFIDNHGKILGRYIKTNIWIPEREYLTSSTDYHASLQPASSSTTTTTTSTTQPPKVSHQNQHHTHTLPHAGIAHSEPLPSTHPHRVFQTPFGPIGILVCWDLAFPSAFTSLLSQNVRLILLPTFWTAFDMSDAGRALNADGEKLFLESALVSRAFENTCMIVFCNAGGPAEEGYLGLSGVYAPIVGRVDGSFVDAEEGCRVVEVDFGVQEVAEENYKIREDLGKMMGR